jgi:hypothetical protein
MIWIRKKNEDGKWESKPTCWRKDNQGDKRQAQLAAQKLSLEERTRAPKSNREHWDAWVEQWIESRYGGPEDRQKTTGTVYRRYWRRWRNWLLSEHLTSPALLSYRTGLAYKEMREEDDTGRNTIIHELKFMGVVMGEAVRRGFAEANPFLRMGLKRDTAAEKIPWTDAQATTVAKEVQSEADWMEVTFLLGFYQAARLRQCEVPLKDINLKARRISYWKSITGRPLTKGDKPFAQPIARAAIPRLTVLMERRAAAGFRSLCDIPELPSVEWRRFLDRLGFHELCHHGLRTTWITKAALSRKISREEAKAFVNHGSTAVHEIYQRLNADDVAHVADALRLPEFE